jgi:Uma2 family endonuclease
MVVQKKLYTVEEFEEFIALPENADRLFELIHGEIVEDMPTELHGYIALKLGARILAYVEDHQLGRVTVEARHRVSEDDHNVRIPDIAFTSKDRALPMVTEGSVPQLPDLVVEIKSPSDAYIGMREKADYYLAHGTRMVWLIFPEKNMIEVYEPDQDVVILLEDETLDGGDVLPGFTLPVRSVFPHE